MKRHRGTLNAYYLVKEANLKKLHAVWFQLYKILEKTKTIKAVKRSVIAWAS